MTKKSKPPVTDCVNLSDLLDATVKARIPDGFKVVADLSTAHLTAQDNSVLASLPGDNDWFIGKYDYGYMLRTVGAENRSEDWQDYGLSDTFFKLMCTLEAHGIYYVCFDQDAPKVREWPVFDW